MMKPGDIVRIEYIRPGKDVTYYEEDFLALDEFCLRTYKNLPDEISARLSQSLLEQNLIKPGQRVSYISKVYFFSEPFNLLIFREKDGSLLGHCFLGYDIPTPGDPNRNILRRSRPYPPGRYPSGGLSDFYFQYDPAYSAPFETDYCWHSPAACAGFALEPFRPA